MGVLDESLAEVVQATIGTFSDVPATLKRVTKSYDAATGTEPEVVTAELSILTSPPEPFSAQDIDGTTILSGDMTVLVAASDLGTFGEPSHQTDRLIKGGAEYRIVRVSPIWAGDAAVAYSLQCRR